MRNQIAAAERIGVRAVTIHSGNRDEWETARQVLRDGTCDVLLISPERLSNTDFTTGVLQEISGSIGMFVIDEAHCISDWGHDFRPDYQRIRRILKLLPPGVPILATTATANDRVVDDVAREIGAGARIFRGPLVRESLRLQVINLADQAERLAWLAENLGRLPGDGIVYCLTVADTQRVSAWLNGHGFVTRPYFAALPTEEREELEAAFLAGTVPILVATVALGMGFDKPDLGFVVHFQRPGSVIAYYQQVGRAGRAIDTAYGILLTGREDDDIAEYFIASAFPPAQHTADIVHELETRGPLTIRQIEGRVNLRRGQIERALNLLEVDGSVARDGGSYFRTPNPWQPDTAHQERVLATRRAELEQMHEYTRHAGCLMEFLARALDDPSAAPCGRCANCRGRGLPASPDPALVLEASRFLRGESRPISPRLRWPSDPGSQPSGRIELPNEPGFALCTYGDAGWGRAVHEGKYGAGEFSDELVDAAVNLLRRSLVGPGRPEWVTALPSAARPNMVASLARRIARGLGIPFVDVLTVRDGAEPQKTMENSSMQFRNALHKLDVLPDRVLAGAVLLVDDVVDSRWTLTVAGWLLRSSGSGPVVPFALAVATSAGS